MADLPLSRKWQFEIHTDRFLPRELRQIKFQIYLQENGNFRFILIRVATLRATDQVADKVADLPVQKMAI